MYFVNYSDPKNMCITSLSRPIHKSVIGEEGIPKCQLAHENGTKMEIMMSQLHEQTDWLSDAGIT